MNADYSEFREKIKNPKSMEPVSPIKTFRCSEKLNLKKAAMAPQRRHPQRSLLSPFMIF